MARKSIRRVSGEGTVTITPSSTEDLLTNPVIDNILATTDVGVSSPLPTSVTPPPTPPVSVVEVPKVDMSPKVIETAKPVQSPSFTPTGLPPLPIGKIAKVQTIKLGAVPTDVSVTWGSHFDPSQCSIYLHRVSVTSNPTGHLSSPVFSGEEPVNVKFRIVRDNTTVPDGSVYLGSYSDVHVGPAMQSLHVFLLP